MPKDKVKLSADLKDKLDIGAKLLAKFGEKIQNAQAELEQIVSDGEITPDEQLRYDELTQAIANWEAHVDRLFPPETEEEAETV